MYSPAVVVWALFAGRPPHPGLSDEAAAAAAADPAIRLRPPTWKMGGAKGLRRALAEGWAHDAGGRPEAMRLLEALEEAQGGGAGCGAGCVVA